MKYALTHCYTDKNKGDAAIIIATTQLIRDIDKNAEINMFSTYGINDKRFTEDHEIIKKYANNIFPACFYEPTPLYNFGDKSRIFKFILLLFKTTLMLVSQKKWFLKTFLSQNEINTFYEFLDSDIIISKGGSYLTTQNNSIRQTLSFIRIMYPFIVARRYNKKVYIFGQSLGPIYGKFNKFLFNTFLQTNNIYLRESLCLKKYNYIKKLCIQTKCKVIPDTAFYLKNNSKKTIIQINIEKYNVGYTLVDHAFKYIKTKKEKELKISQYKKSIIDSMIFLIEKYNAHIHIFPQVLVDNSFEGHNDIKLSTEIKSHFNNTKYKDKVSFYNLNLSPLELQNLYGQMNIFIGTRLHSVIFALSVYVPSINISYHGTKSKGILNNLQDFSDFVIEIDTITSDSLIKTIKKLIDKRTILQQSLRKEIPNIRKKLLTSMREIINNE